MTKPRPITPEERAVISAAKAWEKQWTWCALEETYDGAMSVVRAVRALNAKQAKAKR